MSVYLQHGWGKGQKMQALASAGSLRGVFLSPADEDVATLRRTADEAKALGLRVYVDPQTYIYSTSPRGVGRKHEVHGIAFDTLHWSQDVRAILDQVSRVARMHDTVNPGGIRVAPTVLQTSFDDIWTTTAFQLARTAAGEWGRENTIATLAIEETALDTWRQVDEWLDVATTLDVRGFYILVGRKDTSYAPVAWSTERLSNLLRLIYVLSALNDYQVCWGYSDGEGVAALAAGASAIAAGWNYSLRQFKSSKWQPVDRKGGAAPNVRFYASRLWTPLLAASEAENIRISSLRDQVFSAAESELIQGEYLQNMGVVDAQIQFLSGLATQSAAVTSISGVSPRLDYVQDSLENARTQLTAIDAKGIPLAPRYLGRVDALASAVRRFREAESL